MWWAGPFSDAGLRCNVHQMASGGEQIGQRAGAEQPVEIFGQASIAHLDEAELQLDQREDVLDPGACSGLLAVLVADGGVADQLGPVAPVDAATMVAATMVAATMVPVPIFKPRWPR